MGINVNVSTATTPGLLPVEQPDVTGSWDNPMVMVECVIGCSNQITYGDYNEVTIGGYFDICAGVLLEVTVGATVEVVTPLAVEVIFPLSAAQPMLAAIGAGPAMAAASAMGFAGRASPQGATVTGLQYDVVFGDYTEWVQDLSYSQTGSTFEYYWYKVFWAQDELLDGLDTAAVECSGYAAEGSTTRTLVSNGNIALFAGTELLLLAPLTQIASAAQSIYQFDTSIGLMSYAATLTLSSMTSVSLTGTGGCNVILSDEGIAINVSTSVYTCPEKASLGGAAAPPLVTPLAAEIISQAAAAAAIAQAWAASAEAELLAADALSTPG